MITDSCPRKGTIWLTTHTGRTAVLKTACKTWGCVVCRVAVEALFRARVEIGTSRLERCAFITVTYRANGRAGQPAPVSATDWRALLRRFKRLGGPGKWMKVTELTEKRVPHHHLLVGPVTGRIRCYGRDNFSVRDHVKRMDTCPCLSHVWSREWLAVTGDSYICHATPVIGRVGAGRYLAKYLGKTHAGREDLDSLGYKRRWSCSRDWPGGGRLRLHQTLHGGWRRTDFTTGRSLAGIAATPPDLLIRVGENLTLELAAKRGLNRAVGRLERFAHATVNRA